MIKTRRFWISLYFSILVLLIALCTTCYILASRELDTKSISSDLGPKINENNDGVKIEFRVMSVDLTKHKLDAHITFTPSKNICLEDGRLNRNLLFNFMYYQKQFAVNSTLSPAEIVYPILDGSTSYYPFDKFETIIDLEIIDLEKQERLPIQLELRASISSLKFSFHPSTKINLTNYQRVILNFERPGTIIFFSVFIFIVMWTLSLAVFQLALWTVAFSVERPGASYLGLGSALLFALPSLRNTQPDIPPIGALLDTLGFFWNMILVATSSVIMIGVWIYRFHNESSS